MLVQDFERQKEGLDFEHYVRSNVLITLHGLRGRAVVIEPKELKSAFASAFDQGLKALRQEVLRNIDVGRNFVILLAGGSYLSPGLYNKVNEMIEGLIEVGKSAGITMRHWFVADHEAFPTSAVSVGAALAVLRVPSPAAILGGSAIGLHRTYRQGSRKRKRGVGLPSKRYVGENEAPFMFKVGCGELVSILDDMRNYAGTRVKIQLICDPQYIGAGSGGEWPPLRVGAPEQVLNGPLSTYDLSWYIRGEDLPYGPVRFSLRSRCLQQLAECPDDGGTAGGPIPLFFTCYKVNDSGQETKSRRDRRWLLRLRTDPATRLLKIEEVQSVPAWCGNCLDELKGTVYGCESCTDLKLCRRCHQPGKHPQSHRLTLENIDEDI